MRLTTPKGIEIHHGKIRISFMHNGKRQRISLTDLTLSQASIDYAEKIRSLILEEIKRGVFDMERRFPDVNKTKKSAGQKNCLKIIRRNNPQPNQLAP